MFGTKRRKSMIKKTFLAAKVANAIYEGGKNREWWPFDSRAEFDDFIRMNPLALRGRGTHVIVGFDGVQKLIVKEIESITDASMVSDDSFVLSYSHLTERMLHESNA
jgi:hypothetical protein